jgi:hypothetical protein
MSSYLLVPLDQQLMGFTGDGQLVILSYGHRDKNSQMQFGKPKSFGLANTCFQARLAANCSIGAPAARGPRRHPLVIGRLQESPQPGPGALCFA